MKTVEHARTYMLSGFARIPIEEVIITTFTSTKLNGAVSDGLFAFVPPSNAKLIQDFPDPRIGLGGTIPMIRPHL